MICPDVEQACIVTNTIQIIGILVNDRYGLCELEVGLLSHVSILLENVVILYVQYMST